jgi:outer membrane protein OmpA-like peptidoglycan-associated protein
MLVWLALVFSLAFPAITVAASDLAGSADHPRIGRFEGAWIVAHDVRDFDAYTLPVGPIKNKAGPSISLEGRAFRIAYRQDPGPSMLEVMRNFENRLVERGFEVIFQCDAKACGGYDFRYGIEILPIPQMDVDTSRFRYLAARAPGGEGTPETHVSVLVSNVNKQIRTQVIVVEREVMENRMIDAAAMAEGISIEGHIALYDIRFDYDSAAIKPESEPSLAEIAKMLKAQPDLNVMIVGHTDSEGSRDYNMDLSRRRAASVVDALVKNHGISRDRLASGGVGYLAPVASNRTEEGRALNRRVELIEL